MFFQVLKMIIFLIFKANNAYLAYKDKHIIVNQDVTLSICLSDNWMRYLALSFIYRPVFADFFLFF